MIFDNIGLQDQFKMYLKYTCNSSTLAQSNIFQYISKVMSTSIFNIIIPPMYFIRLPKKSFLHKTGQMQNKYYLLPI